MPELMMTIFDVKKDSLGVRILQRLEKWSIGRVDLVLTVNIACKRIFASRSCNPSKIGIVMNAPDGKIFPLREPRVRQSASDPFSKRFILMYHGSIVERNGLDLAVEALARIRNTVPDLEFRIYGRSTPFLERVMEQVRSQGLEDCVRYLGSKRLEDLVGAIEDCDVGVIPNQRNAFTDINTPSRIFEYLALGKPVIAPRTPGIQDYFGPEALFFFESGNSEELAQRIEYIALHASEAMETAKRGQQVYRSHVWQQERHTLVELVDGLLNPGR